MKHDMANAASSVLQGLRCKKKKTRGNYTSQKRQKLDKQGIMGEQIKLMQQQLKRI